MSETGKPARDETVAFWLQLEPNQHLVGEGIGQHLAHMLSAWSDADSGNALLLAPAWSRAVVSDLFRVYDFPRDRVRVKYFGPPLVSRLLFQKKKIAPRTLESQDFALADRLEKLPAPDWAAVLLAPLAPLLLLPLFLLRLTGRSARGFAGRWTNHILLALRATTFGAMAAYVNRTRRIAFTIVPIGNWSLCRLIRRKPLVVQIPDLVFLEFPEFFDRNAGVNALAEQIRRVAMRADAVVSVSEHVRRKHIIEFMGVSPKRAHFVRHAPMLLEEPLAKALKRPDAPERAEAKAALQARWMGFTEKAGYLDRLGGSMRWLAAIRGVDLAQRRLLYFATQYRPYKNIERAVEAIAALKDAPGPRITLLLTADVSGVGPIMEMIGKEDLWDRVIPLPRLPQPDHALIYAASDLALAASRFEGGFPFLFSEALSVGTPIIMAETPTVRATVPPGLRMRMLFDPHDAKDLARCLLQAFADPGLYLAQSRVLFEMKRDRTWADVVNEYLAAGRAALADPRVAELEREAKRRAKAEGRGEAEAPRAPPAVVPQSHAPAPPPAALSAGGPARRPVAATTD